MLKKLNCKVIVFSLIVLVILGTIISRIGYKFEQQVRLYNREELFKLDSRLKELGVEACLVQPIKKRGTIFVMLSFWEKDDKIILSKIDKIEETISQYIKKTDDTIRYPLIKYFDSDGFPLEITMKSASKMEYDESDPEYHEIVKGFLESLIYKLKSSFNLYIPASNYHIKIIADIKYDVTLNSYKPIKLIFLARFNNANTEQLKKVRILYKKIARFNIERGDSIHFYNLNHTEYKLIEHLSKKMESFKKDSTKVERSNTVLYNPIKIIYSGFKKEIATTPYPDTSPRLILSSPKPSPSQTIKATLSPTPEPTITVSPPPIPKPTQTSIPSPNGWGN